MNSSISSMKTLYLNFIILLVSVLFVSGATAGSIKDEYSVKAALVYNFARFCEWPEDVFDNDQSILRVVIYGDRGLEDIFSKIDGMKVGERQIEVVLVDTPEKIPHCQILFLAKTERNDWPQVMSVLGENSVLTVGEMNGFVESGGVMNLHLDKNKISFEVNLGQAKAKNIFISSRILKLASSVVNKTGAGL